MGKPLLAGFRQAVQRERVIPQIFEVLFRERGLAGGFLAFVQQAEHAVHDQPGLGAEGLCHGLIVERRQRPRLIGVLFQPFHRVGAAHEEAVQRIHHIRDLFFRELMHQGVKLPIFPRQLINAVQRFFHAFLIKSRACALVAQAELRIDPAVLKMPANRLLAERVDGRDLCAGHQIGLTHEPRIALGGLREAGFQPFAHFARRRARKSNDQHSVNAQTVLFDHAHNALHQHGRFAAAGSRAHQQFAVSRVNGLLLGRREMYGHGGTTSF